MLIEAAASVQFKHSAPLHHSPCHRDVNFERMFKGMASGGAGGGGWRGRGASHWQ